MVCLERISVRESIIKIGKLWLTMGNETEYIYSRTKSVSINEAGQEELFLFAALTIVTTALDEPSKRKVNPVFSELEEVLVENAEPEYLLLPNHDLNADISKSEFERLIKVAKENVKEFLLYKPTDHNGEKLDINYYF
jgi:hypothetical protein